MRTCHKEKYQDGGKQDRTRFLKIEFSEAV